MPRKRDRDAARVVHRTARCGLRATRAQRNRLFGLLRSAGDVWCAVLGLNRWRRARQDAPLAGYQELCRQLAASGPGTFGELDSTGARSVLRRYSDAWFTAAKRRRAGDSSARYPRRRRGLVPVRWYAGTFTLDGRVLRIPVARGCTPLLVRLDRDVPYPAGQVRSVTLGFDAGRLYLDVTAEVPGRGPALAAAPAGPARGRQGRRGLGCGTTRRMLAVGDPRGVLKLDAGRRHNQRIRDWRVGHLIRVLAGKAEAAGITVRLVDERGTSSTCPACARRVAKPAGRNFRCPHCEHQGHRDLIAAANIAARNGGGTLPAPTAGAGITHRRAGTHLPGVHPARRDPRRGPPSRPPAYGPLAGTGPPPTGITRPGSRSPTSEEPASRQPRRTYRQMH
jgi:putative transposase-like DNA-binding protein